MSARGGCHCGAVGFELDDDAPERLLRCNCSICTLKGFLHWIVPRERFRLLTPRDALVTYTFNTRSAQHYFCRTCGNCSFYVPRSHPDSISVDAHRVAGFDPGSIPVEDFDGRNWETGQGWEAAQAKRRRR